MKIFLDMDGILTNWCKASHLIHGIDWKDDDWPYACGSAGWSWNKTVRIPDEEFWGVMGYDFWKGIEWYPEGHKVVEICEAAVGYDNVCLLTSPCLTRGAVEGRLAWIDDHLPLYRRKILIGACKEMCASPNHILIDDCDTNIGKWINAGGLSILYPRPWNTNFNRVSLEHLKARLKILLYHE